MTMHDMRSMLFHAVVKVDEAFMDDLPVIQSGISWLDIETGGLAPGEVVLILSPERRAGIEMLLHAVLRKLKPIQQSETLSQERCQVTLWSLCESTVEIGMRFIAAQSGLSFARLRRGKVNDEDWPELIQAVGMLAEREDFLLIDRTVPLQEAKQLIGRHHAWEQLAQRILFVDSAEASLGIASLKKIVQIAAKLSKQIDAPVVIIHSTMALLDTQCAALEDIAVVYEWCSHIGMLNVETTRDGFLCMK